MSAASDRMVGRNFVRGRWRHHTRAARVQDTVSEAVAAFASVRVGKIGSGRIQADFMISTGDLKKGISLELDGQLFTIVDWQHIKMGRGGAIVRI
ncbi:MAG TPA: hypothetical protein VJR48_16150, partial [Ktedonobacterales bacterium]|nr:hypothetical protein [Ktedonobacterales bacterium]